MSYTNIIINSADSVAMITDQLDPVASDGPYSTMRAARYIDGLSNGNFYYTTFTEQIGAVQATGSLTSTGSATNGQTATVANQTLTAKTSGAVPANGEFNISGTVATQAANIALAINSVAALQHIVTATSNSGVVTITAKHPGVSGNGLELSAGNLSNVTASAFSGGSNGTEVVIS